MSTKSKYQKVDTTDNFDVGPDLIDDDDDDIFITPDVETPKSNPPPKSQNTGTPKPQPSLNTARPTGGMSANANVSQGGSFFNLSSFITPQLPSFSVLTTLHRDLMTIGDKLLSILWPLRLRQSLIAVRKISNRFSPGSGDVEDSIGGSGAVGSSSTSLSSGGDEYTSETMGKIRDWDLWGPLVINLGFSLIITYLQTRSLKTGGENSGGKDASSQTFSAAFTLIWASLAVLSINIQLLSPVQQKLENGGMTNGVVGLSFFQCISLLSYALFPIVLGGMFSIFIPFKFVRLIINVIMLLWSLLCTWLIMAIASNCKRKGSLTLVANDDDNQGDQRIFLMVYPVSLVFGLFSWFCVIV
ncbi:hypothetical protein PMKS-002782 [Pichia membranifaciens]|uniref:Protein YIP n=1 Tax=Pichia membranifaciens TaxID=4926 RepID=A0A1Q2YID3_9ASCO|nr:hypothetical protein PMKS-002782 [Pichia membranifaciens]